MPYLVVCPNCATKLKSPTPLAAGRSLNCPQCKGQFTLTEPAVAIDPAGRPITTPAPPPPAGGPRADRPPVPARLVPPPVRKRPDELPDAEFVDDEDDRPPVRRRDDEDDDRPRARRRPRDEEDDDRPRSRSRRDDDDEDDRPKDRGRRGRDDEEEDVPPPPPRRRKKKQNKGLLIGLLAGAAALLFCCGGGSVLYFADPFGWFGGASSDMLAWAPADSQAVMYMDVDGMSRLPEAKDQLHVKNTDVARYGIRTDEVAAVLGAGRSHPMGGDPEVTVVQLKAAANQSAIVAASGGTEATAGGKKYYRTRTGGGLYFPSSRLVVITQAESILTARLGKDEGKVVISEDLRAATRRGDGLVWIAASGQAAEQADFIGKIAGFANMFGRGGFAPGGFAPGGPGPARPARARSTVMAMKASGGTATIRFESTYDTSDAARKMADDLRRALDANRASIESGETFDVSSSGATVTLTVTGPIKKKGAGPFPFGFGR
jgi:hypothetical protein